MPTIILNELSAAGQAAHAAAADELMRELAASYKALEPMICDGALYTHSALGTGQLTQTMTVYGWLAQRHSGSMQAVRLLILTILNRLPKIDNWLRDNVPAHACQQTTSAGNISREFSALAGAAHKGGWLLSLHGCPDFPQGLVEVDYSEQGTDLRRCQLEHIILQDDLRSKLRVYEANPKHKATPGQNNNVSIAPMDLLPDEAQRVLHCARDIPNEYRLFGLYKGKVYVFFAHTENHYHGYLLENAREYQSRDARIYNQLLAWGWVK